MPRYIDADALRKEFSERPPDYYSTGYILDTIDELPALSTDEVRGVGEWTSVEERLPDVAEKVLTYNGDFVSENWLCTVASKVGRINVWAYSEGFVTHWMPLPKAPKEVE